MRTGVNDRSILLFHVCSGHLTSAMHLSERVLRDALTLRLAHVQHIQRSTMGGPIIMRSHDTLHVDEDVKAR